MNVRLPKTYSFNADRSPLIHSESAASLSRREFLVRNGVGFGGISLAALFGLNPFDANAAAPPSGPLAPKAPHFPAKAKTVIQIFSDGAPSSVDTWDPKPELSKADGKKIPGYEGYAFGSPFKFEKKGKSGTEVCELFPEIGKHIDDIAVIRSLFQEIPAHGISAQVLMTGSPQLPRPSLGSWVTYGLGSVNQNMPGFISLGGETYFRQCAFLPGIYQGCNVNYDPNMSLSNVLSNIRSEFSSLDRQRRQLDFAAQSNREHAALLQRDAQLEARIETFEIAYKMQTEATDAFDISKEPEAMREKYMGKTSMGAPGLVKSNGAKLLVARRLAERGVRFIQVMADGNWDHHDNLAVLARTAALGIDGPIAALLQDLKDRRMLDSTLVLWGGEFGRTATSQSAISSTPGRDHNGQAMVSWMAGGGVKGGVAYGETDTFGGRVVKDKMHIHDLHATYLALLGFDHTKLTYNYNGREFRLTDNFGNVVKELIA